MWGGKMANIIIQVDTREQDGKNQHVLDYFKSKNIGIVRSKLFVGDYTLLHNQSVVVDRKKDMLEIAGNICNQKEHIRFREELENAQKSGIKLYILIEDEYIYNIDGVKYYKCPTYKGNQYKVVNGVRTLSHKRGEKRSQVNFETLGKAMKTMEEKYGCTFMFAKRENFGKKVLQILGVEK